MSVRLSACITTFPTWRPSVKFVTADFCENLSRKSSTLYVHCLSCCKGLLYRILCKSNKQFSHWHHVTDGQLWFQHKGVFLLRKESLMTVGYLIMRERLCTENHEWNPWCILAIRKSSDQRALDTLGLTLPISNSRHCCYHGSKCSEYSSNIPTFHTDGKNVTVVWAVTSCNVGASDHNTGRHTTDDRNCQSMVWEPQILLITSVVVALDGLWLLLRK
jgi:hypothetical protein